MKIFKIILIFCFSIVASNAAYSQGNILANQEPLTGSYQQMIPKQSVETRAGEDVKQLERFYRVYEDGTIEFKYVLSNGVAQYQKITNKEVNGKTIQVYEGYNSEYLPDKTYRTTYYIADENGYRRIRREFDTKPPVLPPYVPYVPKPRKGQYYSS